MSATLQVETFRDFFGKDESAVVRVKGRQFGVDVFFCDEAQEDYVDAACVAALQVGGGGCEEDGGEELRRRPCVCEA